MNNWLVIRGYNEKREHVITCEVSGAREANQLLQVYANTYPEYTFTMRAS